MQLSPLRAKKKNVYILYCCSKNFHKEIEERLYGQNIIGNPNDFFVPEKKEKKNLYFVYKFFSK